MWYVFSAWRASQFGLPLFIEFSSLTQLVATVEAQTNDPQVCLDVVIMRYENLKPKYENMKVTYMNISMRYLKVSKKITPPPNSISCFIPIITDTLGV